MSNSHLNLSFNLLNLIREAETQLFESGGARGKGIKLDEYYGFGAYMMSYGIAPEVINID
jgi:hypothetical protein